MVFGIDRGMNLTRSGSVADRPRFGCYPLTAETETSAETALRRNAPQGALRQSMPQGIGGPGKFSYVYKYEAGPPSPS
jgi:hypothetical protein